MTLALLALALLADPSDAGVPVAGARPPDPVALIAAGDKAIAARDFRTALFAYQDAEQAAPRNLDAILKVGTTYYRMGHDDEAIAEMTRALAIDGQNSTARETIAAARERKALLAPPPPPTDEAGARAHYSKGVELVQKQKFAEAAAELDQALSLKPGWASAFIARGSARIGLGRYPDALSDYAAARKADPSLAAPLFGLAEAYRGLGQSEKAAQYYREYAKSNAADAQQSLKDYALQQAQGAPK